MSSAVESSARGYKNANVLITGGLGFIGSTLAIALVKAGARVTIVDALIPNYGGNLFNIEPVKNKVEVIYTDIRNAHLMNELVKHRDYIFNFAGTLSHVDSVIDPFTDLDINCRAQLSLLEACRQFNPKVKILFAGTRNQYGRARYLPVDETHPQVPIDINGINNIAGESYHLLYYTLHGIKATSLRLSNTYGPRHQMHHSRQGVLNWFIRQALDHETITLYGTGGQVRDTVYIDDVVRAFLLSGLSPKVWGKAFNIGAEPIDLKSFVQKVIRSAHAGRVVVGRFPPDRKKIEIGDYIADWSLAQKTFGWKPKVPFDKGIQKTIEYYRSYRMHYWNRLK